MKKFLLSLAALVMSTGAVFAQSETDPTLPATGVSFSVAGQTDNQDGSYTISSRTAEVTITLADFDSESYVPFILYSNGAGFAISEPMPIDYEQEAANKFVIELTNGNWGNPYMEYFYCNLMVAFMNDEGEMFTIDDEPFFYQTVYITPNTLPAALISVYPDGEWIHETFADAYNRDEIRFNFANELTLAPDDLIGEINYTRFDGTLVDPVDIELGENAEAGWNPMDGCFTITVNYAIEGVPASAIEEIEISLDTLNSQYGSVTVDPVLLVNTSTPNVQRISKKSPAASGLAVSNETVSVYNVAGMLVKENIAQSEVNALPKGLYIVNGKKVVVK